MLQATRKRSRLMLRCSYCDKDAFHAAQQQPGEIGFARREREPR